MGAIRSRTKAGVHACVRVAFLNSIAFLAARRTLLPGLSRRVQVKAYGKFTCWLLLGPGFRMFHRSYGRGRSSIWVVQAKAVLITKARETVK
jgi:hypothetical protein